MGLPAVTQTWRMSFNNRYVWNSLTSTNLAEMGAFMFSLLGVGGFLTATMGYTCKGSSDGTTAAMDGVNRITSPSKWATRHNGAAGAMSWVVLTDGAGVNWCFAYNASADTIVRLSHSTGGNFVAAGTPTQQPTATDECFDSESGDWVVAGGTRCDQVWHLWSTTDKKMFRIVTCSQSCLALGQAAFGAYIAGEKFTSALVSLATFALATGGGTVGATKSYYYGCNGTFTLNYFQSTYYNPTYGPGVGGAGDLCRANTTSGDGNSQATHAGELPGGQDEQNGYWTQVYPGLQGKTGLTIFPTTMGALNAGYDGMLGTKIDQWNVLVDTTSGGTIPFLSSLGNYAFWYIAPCILLVGDGSTAVVAT